MRVGGQLRVPRSVIRGVKAHLKLALTRGSCGAGSPAPRWAHAPELRKSLPRIDLDARSLCKQVRALS